MRKSHKTLVKKATSILHSSFFYIWLDVGFSFRPISILIFLVLEATPVNGESEEKKNEMEVGDKSKSPLEEENNDGTGSSPNRSGSLIKCTVF